MSRPERGVLSGWVRGLLGNPLYVVIIIIIKKKTVYASSEV